MKQFRGSACLAIVLIVGSTALPSQSSPSYPRSVGKSKQTTTPFRFADRSSDAQTIGSNSVTGSSDENGKAGKNGGATTLPLPSPSPSGTMLTDRNTLVDMTERTSTISSIAETRTERGTTAAGNRGAGTSTGTGTASTASAAATATATTTTTTTTTNANSSPGSGTSAAPTETSSRTIASVQGMDAVPSAPKKTATSVNEFTTTPAAISPKETRESAGKIRPQIKLTTNYSGLGETGVRLPEGASAALAKPTKYHYYPHNQHIYLLPECAVQQVCNAVYVRLNFTQPLCACPGRYRDPCSASLDSDDLHTTELVTDPRTKALTLVKTCEPVAEMRECRTPRDWSLLALQNVRTGKSHYLVICRCPDANILEGPMSHDQPTYASVPGIRVYGMMCVQGNRRGRPLRYARNLSDYAQRELGEGAGANNGPRSPDEQSNDRLSFPWYRVHQLMNTVDWD